MNIKVSPYHDFWLRLVVSVILTFFFVFLGTSSLIEVVNGKYFIADCIATFTLSFIITTGINIISALLDKQYSWSGHFVTRIFYQIIAGVFIPSVFVLAFMYTYLIVLLGFDKREVQFFHTEFPIAILFIIFWNVYYTGMYFFYEAKKSKALVISLTEKLYTLENIQNVSNNVLTAHSSKLNTTYDEARSESEEKVIKTLVAVSGNKNIPIPVEEIAYFFKEGNYTTLKTFGSETYLLNHTLDELTNLLGKDLFFRANRQYIINIKSCRFFTNEENGKLSLELEPAVTDEVVISQKRATLFKEWLNK